MHCDFQRSDLVLRLSTRNSTLPTTIWATLALIKRLPRCVPLQSPTTVVDNRWVHWRYSRLNTEQLFCWLIAIASDRQAEVAGSINFGGGGRVTLKFATVSSKRSNNLIGHLFVRWYREKGKVHRSLTTKVRLCPSVHSWTSINQPDSLWGMVTIIVLGTGIYTFQAVQLYCAISSLCWWLYIVCCRYVSLLQLYSTDNTNAPLFDISSFERRLNYYISIQHIHLI